MLKNLLLLIGVFAVSFQLFALRPGDVAEEPLRVTWVKGKDFRFAFPKDNPDNSGKLSIGVFVLCRAPQSPATVNMFESMAAKYGKKINIAIITPDHGSDLDALLKKVKVERIAAGFDRERKLTANFMAGSPLYPMAFATDSDGRIIWCGEAVDAPEMAERYFSGKFDARAARKISPLLDELHLCLRNNDDRKMNNLVDEILTLEPGNAAALRLRLFSLEQRNRKLEAWQLLERELKRSPKLARLYFTSVDLILRDPRLSNALGQVLESFIANVNDPTYRSHMAYTLCEMHHYNAAAVNYAVRMLKDIDLSKASVSTTALYWAAKASAAYRLCRLGEAVTFQTHCVDIWKKAGNTANMQAAQRRLDYYLTLGK
ncbi:MAG: hypothetical protein J6R00_05690 [Lentisphaeria bacterium]|nr:hypothetical protein [Lentisphaeria bacterium]